MTVRELIKTLIDVNPDAIITIEVRTDQYSSFSSAEDVAVENISNDRVLIFER